MKRTLIIIAAIFLIVAIGMSVGLTTLSIYANNNIDYSIDERLFEGAKDSNTVTYMAYNSNGELYEVWKSSLGGRKTWVNISDVSPHLISGFISMEDRDFYHHNGVNIKRTIAATINYLTHRGSSFGASTITQQVIKNISGDNDHTIGRKINEIFRAMRLEGTRSKEEILEVYLNIVPMSGNIYGVREASMTFFGKEPIDLELHEAATIVGITNAPGKYNPYTESVACTKKRNNVLYAMYDNGVINQEDYNTAINKPLGVNSEEKYRGDISSWFIETANDDIIRDLVDRYGVSKACARLLLYNGTTVILTMNPIIQSVMENYFENTDNLPGEIKDGLQLSMVVSDSKTGDLLGIVGGAGEKCGDRLLNYATIPHTPGSTLKPIALYAPLFEKELINWSTIFDDAPSSYREENGEIIPYPKNSPDVYQGRITVCDALKRSKNTVAIEMYDLVGGENIINSLRKDYGFKTIVEREVASDGSVITDKAPSPLALGQLTNGVTLRDLTRAYTVFPRSGVIDSGRSYYGVFDYNGGVLLDNSNKPKLIMKSATANIMNMMLSKVVEDGTAASIRLKELVDTAGKTGTSGGDRDRLFVGYTPYYTAGIWCGYPTKQSINSLDKSHLRIWDEVMIAIHESTVFTKNEMIDVFSDKDLEIRQYCKSSGMLASDGCSLDGDVEWGYYTLSNMPEKICPFHEHLTE